MPDIEKLLEESLAVFEENVKRLPQERLDGDATPEARSYVDILPHKTRKFATYSKQMECLSKVCDISDAEFCRRKLQEIPYFRLKGYSLALREKLAQKNNVPIEETVVPFETVCRVYECDEQFRSLLLYALQKIEVFLRSQMSYFHAMKYTPYGYLDKNHYDYPSSEDSGVKKQRHNHHDFLEHLAEAVKSNKDKPFVQHYLIHYDGIMPLWAVSELMTFGDLARFYEDWKEADRVDFLGNLYSGSRTKRKIAEPRFISWLECCRKLRNVCAHCGQLYDRNFPWNPRLPREFRQNRKPVTRKLWTAVLAVQFLYPDEREWTNWVTPYIQSVLDIPAKSEAALLRDGLGFPNNWKDWLNIWKTL